nr:XdhC family protein [Pseudonocardia acidicola]
MLARVDDLRAGRTPFVLATVVRAERPTSAKPGDCALVLPDGTIDGFVGGVCAESTVRLEGLRLLAAGESGLLRITPSAGGDDAPVEGVRTVGNPCLSGGTLEIFLEAMVPPTLISVFGEAPVARALVRVGTALDYDVRAGADPSVPVAADTAAVVVASHGRDEAAVLRAALRAEVPYIALVASRRRAAGVREELAALGVPAEQLDRVHAPAGLDIGARTAPEIALSVFADIVARRPRSSVTVPDTLRTEPPAERALEVPVPDEPPPAKPAPLQIAIDPVCGMEVALTPAGVSARHGGQGYWFCGTGCRQAFLDDPARFTG